MIITRIELYKGNRYKIFGEDGYLFSLYKKELTQFNIEEGLFLDDSVVSRIYDEVIFKRSKERALYLLDRQPYSSASLRRKLVSSGTPECIADRVVDFLKEYHYLDDEEYVALFVDSNSHRKSKRQMVSDLLAKGIDKQLIDSFFDEYDTFDCLERECFLHKFNKYTKGKDINDIRIKQKVFRYFYGKGFSVELINEALEHNR
ncbi:MAG: regulatory protein RecX [Lachnospiraceae bacterium]|nr:regulatory protein RecX [Lachnospiraceae bacterium]